MNWTLTSEASATSVQGKLRSITGPNLWPTSEGGRTGEDIVLAVGRTGGLNRKQILDRLDLATRKTKKDSPAS